MKTVLAMSTNDWAKAFLGFVLGLAAAVVIGWWSARDPHLAAETSEVIQFQGDQNKISIFNAIVRSDGRKEVEDVECLLTFKNGSPQEVKTSPPELNAKTTTTGGIVTITVPLMNPGESLQIAALIGNVTTTEKPGMSVRGKGVVGDFAIGSASDSGWNIFGPVGSVLSVLIAILITMFVNHIRDVALTSQAMATDILKEKMRGEFVGPVEHILATKSGQSLLSAAVTYYGPHEQFTVASLASKIGAKDSDVANWVRQIGRPEKKFGIKVIERHGDGSYTLTEEMHARIKRVLEQGDEED